jgi:transposase
MPREPIVFQEGVDAIDDSLQRLRRLETQLALVVPEWSMAPVVEAYQAMRGASFLVAVTFAAEIGDVRRFDRHDSSHRSSDLSRRKARPATRSDGRASPWPATGARVGSWSRRPGPIVIPQGSARP